MARLSRAARPTRPLRDMSDDDDDEFPDIAVLVKRKIENRGIVEDNEKNKENEECSQNAEIAPKPPASVRRRKLVPIANNNALLRAWTPDSPGDKTDDKSRRRKESRAPRVELRTKSTKNAPPRVQLSSTRMDLEQEDVAEEEEVTIIEEVSVMHDNEAQVDGHDDDDDSDDVFQSAESNVSSFEDDDDDSDDSLTEFFARTARPKKQDLDIPSTNHDRARTARKGKSQEKTTISQAKTAGETQDLRKQKSGISSRKDLTDTFSRLNLDDIPILKPEDDAPRRREQKTKTTTTTTPPASPPPLKSKPAGLVSPKKLPRIPQTPHRPSSDMFWSQDFIDDWNDEHSPRKQLFPDAVEAAKKKKNTSKKDTGAASPAKNKAVKPVSAREAKKAFEKEKHEMAQRFLQELDTVITNGKLTELAASTGGIKLNWTNKLNTTAGRANWKRETIRTTAPAGNPSSSNTSENTTTTTTVKHKHHASIELAEKVIDDEHRLLNVMAHEFCHLANFMISGITTNPHGKEFKSWAAKCSAAFGHRGIEVTTKHSYDIDFKYIWECADCGMAYKRHSKSINPERHRCGGCKGELRQIKPVPRGGGGGAAAAGGGGKKQPSEYQVFMKEQMRLLREENPGSPQKDIMKLVASRWAERGRGAGSGSSRSRSETPTLTPAADDEGLEKAVKTLEIIEIED